MDIIRKNDENEEILAHAKCRMPASILIASLTGLGVFFAFLLAMIIIIVSNRAYDYIYWYIIPIILFVVLLIYFIFRVVTISKTGVFLTNKRIYGTAVSRWTKINYSYRLDTINGVELGQSFGYNTIIIDFLHGNDRSEGNSCSFIIKYLIDCKEFYETINDRLLSIKNDKDLQTDIQLKSIDAENKKASAFEKIADTYSTDTTKTDKNFDYITQLKGLKELLDSGVITQQEFEEKKKKLLEL